MPRIHRPKQYIRLAIVVLVLFILISACTPGVNFSAGQNTPTATIPQTSPTLQGEVVFRVQVPLNTPDNRPVYLDIVDEVTGLAFNPMRYRMESQSPNHYMIRLPIQIGSVVQYRYVLGGNPLAIEHTGNNKQVRYRSFPVNGPDVIQDIVAGWSGYPFTGETGRIFGTVIDIKDGSPVVDVLVSAGGLQTISAADGSFLLDGLVPGTHQVTVYSIHGDHAAFEQSALVEPGTATFAELPMAPVEFVDVSFIVEIPKLPVDTAQVRLIGNLYSLGNTYGDLGGGISTIASRAPSLTELGDGKYGITLRLPVGFDLHYKYSLGDGFWNAEHKDGKFRVRHLIVPPEGGTIEDTVETWASGGFAPLVFTVRVPENTPADDTISIQFNPYTWMEPIPMWRSGHNEWVYTISSPLDLLGDVRYRYCRNDLCTIREDSVVQQESEMVFTASTEIQYFQDQIDRWLYLSPVKHATIVPSLEVDERAPSFVAGIEFSPHFQTSGSAYQKFGLNSVRALNGNLLVITPTWSYIQQNPPILTSVPGKDGLWADFNSLAEDARQMSIPLAVYPIPTVDTDLIAWWETAERDLSWWYSWYDQYQTFLIHYANYAQKVGAKALIIGGPEVSPSFPNGKLGNGSSSETPDESDSRWREIIAEVRKRYDGQLMLALPYDGEVISPPPFLQEFDQIYLLWSAPLSEKKEAPYMELADAFGYLLEKDVRPLQANSGMPVVLAVSFPSFNGAMQGCRESGLECEDYMMGMADGTALDLQEQVDLYNAALTAINERDWIEGIVSRGFISPVVLQDRSSNIHGKPAWDVLWYWYPLLLDVSQTEPAEED